jgi:serine/threonine-protein kinase
MTSSSTLSSSRGGQKTIVLGSLIIGSLIGASVVITSILNKSPDAPLPVPVASQSQQPTQPMPIGWVRLGAVSNTSGTASVGEPLIPTTQPVSISPPVVPSIGNQVTVTNGINYRKSWPQPPNYQLADKIGALLPGQKISILRLETFTDPTTSSPYTVVWAEVSFSQ